MAREIHIVKPEIINGILLYDGKVCDKRRREFSSLDSLLNSIPGSLRNLDPKRKLEVYVRGLSDFEIKYLIGRLSKKLPKAYYVN